MRFGKVELFEVGIVNLGVEFIFLIIFVFELFIEGDDLVEFILWFELVFNLFFVRLLVFFVDDGLNREFFFLWLNCGVDLVVLDCLNFFMKLFFKGLLYLIDVKYLEDCDLGLLYELGIDFVWLLVLGFFWSEFKNFFFVDFFECLEWDGFFLIFVGVFVVRVY